MRRSGSSSPRSLLGPLRSATRASAIAMVVVGGLFVALPGAAVVALPACDIPSKTCFGDRVNARLTDAGDPEPSCTACVQSACCDAVGVCHEDPVCLESFRTAHSCVLANGPGEESRCTTNLTPRARTLYACMRKSCGGATCGVPNCDVDRAAPLIVNPDCDRCVGGACCEKLNACFGDRRCKLILECILDKCQPTLGDSMDQLGAIPRALRDQTRADVCAGGAPPGGPDSCISTCINDFAPVGDKGTTDDQSARCRAFDVFACSADAKCGRKCAARADAGTSPDDASAASDASDAGTD